MAKRVFDTIGTINGPDRVSDTQLAPGARITPVAGDAPNYPGYVIRYDGNAVPPDETFDPLNPHLGRRITIGPHGFHLDLPQGSITIRVDATRMDTVIGVPDLKITITKSGQ